MNKMMYIMRKWQCKRITFKSSQRAAGKIYLFYSPSQERVRHFSSREMATKIVPRTYLPDQKQRGWKKKKEEAMTGRMRKTKENFSGKVEATKSWIKVYNLYLFCHLIRYFMFARRKVSSEQKFQRTAAHGFYSLTSLALSRWSSRCNWATLNKTSADQKL